MKANSKKKKKLVFFLVILFFIFLGSMVFICLDQIENLSFETKEVHSKIKQTQKKEQETQIKDNPAHRQKEYENFPIEYKGYKVVGKINIPKLEIEKYILEQTTEQTLKVAVTKTYGPKANEVGNFCISGHNYVQTFGRLKELEIGDKIKITDPYNQEITYQIYKIYKVNPTDTTCLSQETNGEKEITLITCTLGAIKRTIVKAVEVYD